MNAEERKEVPEINDDTAKRSKERGGAGELFRSAAVGFFCSVIGYLLGICTLPFGAMPLGIGFLCAASRHLPYILAGVCLAGAFSEKAVILVCTYLAVLLLRVLFRLTLDPKSRGGERASEILSDIFCENIFLRMTVACVGAFIVGIYTLTVGGFLYYDLYGAIVSMVAAPAAAFAFSGAFDDMSSRGEYGRFGFFSCSVLAFASIYSARAVEIYGVSLAAFAAMFATLYICRKRGVLLGVVGGIVCGLAYSPVYAPSFIFAAVAFGALRRVSSALASLAAFALGMAWGFYIAGLGAITGLMPATLAASLLFCVTDKLFIPEKKTESEKGGENTAEEIVLCRETEGDAEMGAESFRRAEEISAASLLSPLRCRASEQRIEDICTTLNDMSGFFRELGTRMRKPLAADMKQICDNAFEASCGSCELRELCWEEDHTRTISAINSLSAVLHKSGRVSADDIPEDMRRRCRMSGEIVDEINHNCMLHTKQLLLCDKTEIFALDYEAVASLLESSMRVDEEEYAEQGELSERIRDALEDEGFEISAVVAYGSKRRRVAIFSRSCEYLRRECERMLRTVSEICGERYEAREPIGGDAAYPCLILSVAQKYSAEFAKRSIISSSEEVFCGDTVNIFSGREDRLYALVSDGMGSGRDAALTSGICSMFIEKMLSATDKCDKTLRLLNGFLRNKGGGSMHECSATVDLMELDLVGGKAAFFKSGAAPSYVFRDRSLFKLRSKTAPVGIIRELDAKKISFDLADGDLIIMVSDGVTQGRDECPWLLPLLKSSAETDSLEHITSLIAERARREGGDDDISVAMIKIKSH